MKKFTFALALLSVTAFAASSLVPAFACDSKGGQCAMKKGGCGGGQGCGKDHSSSKGGCPIMGKFMKKADFFLDNSDAVGLSDEQKQAISALKTDMLKLQARQQADMTIWMLDMQTHLHADKVDVAAMSAMIDQGTAGMAQGAKTTVEAYAKLKGIPSEQQMQKLKEIWKAKKSDSGSSAHAH